MRRVLSIWLPTLITDHLTRPGQPGAPWRDAPLATVTTRRNALVLDALNPAARGLGLTPGLTLADARARAPGVRAWRLESDPPRRWLARLAEACGGFTPRVAVDGVPDGPKGGGLILDITGCALLFGGEEALAGAVRARLTRAGYQTRVGGADTVGAAWAAARFLASEETPVFVLPEGAQRQLLAGLPGAALRLPPDVVETLAALGIRDIGALMRLPRRALAARLGPVVGQRLDQALGAAPEPVAWHRPEAPVVARRAFPEPLGTPAGLEAALDALLNGVTRALEARHQGVRRLRLTLELCDGGARELLVGTHQPTRDPRHLAGLLREPLACVEVGFGVDALVARVLATDPLPPGWGKAVLPGMEESAPSAPGSGLACLLDRLAGRLGEAPAVLLPRARFWPEEAVRPAVPLTDGGVAGARVPWPQPAPRPVRLFAPPLPACVRVDEAGVPRSLSLGATAFGVRAHDGPECLGPPWWNAPGEDREPPRTYWRVETGDGRRLWLVHAGHAWAVHGVFP
ncbi:Y-family DNA polymerase [Pararhodospirillum oryzae]|uniref:Nucleotidyltransferase n=1 Tax=Pararhodospirillum oryzae TaxID=478448 RepID=A0A512H9A3_9PROT|nr:DNA polymerase Y family protein [Pararhodospirillum oryzae]GEO82024.1 hypothetical protein ROR02_21550 [Pararhodospirillum oryzae]